MTQHDPLVTLRQLIEFCEASRTILGDRDAAAVENDLIVSFALTRALELVGEAANRLPVTCGAAIRRFHGARS